MTELNVSRRSFLGMGALGTAIAAFGLSGFAGAAHADEKATEAATATATINSSGIIVDPSKVEEVIDTQILVVGGGISGLAAAVQAAQNGDNVVLLEGQSALGGNGQGVEGSLGVDTKWQKEQGIECDRSIVMQEELGKAQWVPNGLFYKDLMDNSAANLEWCVEECGCELEGTIDNYPLGTLHGAVDTFHWWKDGAAFVGYVQPMEAHLRSFDNATIDLNTRALEFSYDEEGKVNGVYALDAFNDIVQYTAKAVIVATGGFADDDGHLKRLGFDLDTLQRIGTPGHYGDGVNMVLAAGAMEYTGICYLKYNRISHNNEIAMFGPFWSALCFGGPFLWLNEDLERFVDESCTIRVGNICTMSTPIHQQPHCTALSVWDRAVHTAQLDLNRELAGEWGVDLQDQWDTIVADADDAWQADTIEDLAAAAGVDAGALQAAIDDYNALCADGKDAIFGKDAEYMKPIETAPFYMARIHEAMEGPLGGVTIDRSFRPRLIEGGTFDNVFCVGLDSMMLYRDVYPIDVPGSASAECINGGRTAANAAHDLL